MPYQRLLRPLYSSQNSALAHMSDDDMNEMAQAPGFQTPLGTSPANQFAALAGLTAEAISPNTWGGRLGRNVAGYAMRNEARADPYNQLLFRSRLAARGEQERQRKLQGLVGRLGGGAPRQSLSVQEAEPMAPGASPSAFGVSPVTTSLVGVERQDASSQGFSSTDVAELVGLLGPQGAQAFMEQSARFGHVPMTPGERAAGFKPTSAGGSQFNAATGQYEGGQAPQTNTQLQIRPGATLPPSAQYPTGYTAPLLPQQGVVLKPGERGPFGVTGVEPQEPVYSPGQIAAGVKPILPGSSPYNVQEGTYGPQAPLLVKPNKPSMPFRSGAGGMVYNTQTGEVVRQPTSRSATPATTRKPTRFEEEVAAAQEELQGLVPTHGKPGWFGTSYGATPAQTQEEAEAAWATDPLATASERSVRNVARMKARRSGGKPTTTVSKKFRFDPTTGTLVPQ